MNDIEKVEFIQGIVDDDSGVELVNTPPDSWEECHTRADLDAFTESNKDMNVMAEVGHLIEMGFDAFYDGIGIVLGEWHKP